mgnify:CR=1 FL=1
MAWLIECRGYEKFVASDADLRLFLHINYDILMEMDLSDFLD